MSLRNEWSEARRWVRRAQGRGERIVGHVREGGGLCRRARLDDLDGFDEDDVTIFRLSKGQYGSF